MKKQAEQSGQSKLKKGIKRFYFLLSPKFNNIIKYSLQTYRHLLL